MGSDRDTLRKLGKKAAHYWNGSTVSILAASQTSVRGPHIPFLKLDEIDEMLQDILDSAMGMALEIRGVKTSVLMTSTYHRVAGPMAALMERGKNGPNPFPVDTFCLFEVLERCPEERSGPRLENCPVCPIVTWCHAGRGDTPDGLPKAKRSSGHYTIDSFIQKLAGVTERTLKSDYLCLDPRAAGVWFGKWDEALHVTPSAEYDPRLPVHVSIDPGVETGGVWFQLRRTELGRVAVNVFADYYSYDLGANQAGVDVVRRTDEVCGVGYGIGACRTSMDPSGNAKNAVGPVVRSEYLRAGLKGRHGLESWDTSKKNQGLQLVEALLMSADGVVSLTVHPRCKHLRAAFPSYVRGKVRNEWLDTPKDPQHPFEDVIDPLCGALKLELPEGLKPPSSLRQVSARGL